MFKSVSFSNRVGSGGVLVVGVFAGQKAVPGRAGDKTLAAALSRGEATGSVGSIVEAFPTGSSGKKAACSRVIIVGLGKKNECTSEVIRNAAGAVGRRLAAIKATAAMLDFAHTAGEANCDAQTFGRALGEGLGLIGWTCDQFHGKAGNLPERVALKVGCDDKAMARGIRYGLGMAQGSNLARTLSQTPPNVATTTWMAAQARKLARQTGLKCTVYSGKQLDEHKLVGLKTVGQASEHKPCLVRLEYIPKGKTKASSGKPIVLVGKTMTYDTGGLSLKVNNGMVGMKRDKDGGCGVLGAMYNIATVIKPKSRVVALLSIAENSISNNAYRPDDVMKFANGVTVEVTNTDAEGRLVLADGLCWACAREDPKCVVDIATLTGGVVVALGSTFAGLWCEDDRWRSRVEKASAACGERVWRLPMHQEYRDMMKSPIADILNSNPNRKAHPIQGAAFLSYFVRPGVPWVHLDIAGVHAVDKDSGPYIAGPTGFGARLLSEFVSGG